MSPPSYGEAKADEDGNQPNRFAGTYNASAPPPRRETRLTRITAGFASAGAAFRAASFRVAQRLSLTGSKRSKTTKRARAASDGANPVSISGPTAANGSVRGPSSSRGLFALRGGENGSGGGSSIDANNGSPSSSLLTCNGCLNVWFEYEDDLCTRYYINDNTGKEQKVLPKSASIVNLMKKPFNAQAMNARIEYLKSKNMREGGDYVGEVKQLLLLAENDSIHAARASAAKLGAKQLEKVVLNDIRDLLQVAGLQDAWADKFDELGIDLITAFFLKEEHMLELGLVIGQRIRLTQILKALRRVHVAAEDDKIASRPRINKFVKGDVVYYLNGQLWLRRGVVTAVDTKDMDIGVMYYVLLDRQSADDEQFETQIREFKLMTEQEMLDYKASGKVWYDAEPIINDEEEEAAPAENFDAAFAAAGQAGEQPEDGDPAAETTPEETAHEEYQEDAPQQQEEEYTEAAPEEEYHGEAALEEYEEPPPEEYQEEEELNDAPPEEPAPEELEEAAPEEEEQVYAEEEQYEEEAPPPLPLPSEYAEEEEPAPEETQEEANYEEEQLEEELEEVAPMTPVGRHGSTGSFGQIAEDEPPLEEEVVEMPMTPRSAAAEEEGEEFQEEEFQEEALEVPLPPTPTHADLEDEAAYEARPSDADMDAFQEEAFEEEASAEITHRRSSASSSMAVSEANGAELDLISAVHSTAGDSRAGSMAEEEDFRETAVTMVSYGEEEDDYEAEELPAPEAMMGDDDDELVYEEEFGVEEEAEFEAEEALSHPSSPAGSAHSPRAAASTPAAADKFGSGRTGTKRRYSRSSDASGA